MITDDINIRKTPIGYCCVFHINNKKFRADISSLFRPECLIFECDVDGEIIQPYIYRNTHVVTVSKKSLLKCIKEFAEKECKL